MPQTRWGKKRTRPILMATFLTLAWIPMLYGGIETIKQINPGP